MAYADVAAGASESPNPRRSGTMTLYPASRSGFICINIRAQNLPEWGSGGRVS